MRILIFGANGKIGSLVVDLALSRGHEVTGFYRSPDHIDKRVKSIVGDATNSDDVASAVAGCEVVISCLGHVKVGDPIMQTKAISNIISAMEKQGMKRLVSLTGSGARLPGDKPSLIDRILNWGLAKVDPDKVSDGTNHIHILQDSSLDWTVVRTLKHSNIKPSPNLILTEGGPARLLSSRIQIAETMLDLAESNDWIKKAPILS
jgi:putative NADH-flavin reductase